MFLDTAFAIALVSVNDRFNAQAMFLADQLEVSGTRLVTTRAVLLEIGQSPDAVRDASVRRGKLSFLPGEPETDTAI